MKNPDATEAPRDELEALRVVIERIDDGLLDGLRARIACCVRIAEIKQRSGIAMMQPDRVRRVHERAATYATHNGLDLGFVRRFYELIIEETCRVETLVMTERER